MMMQSLRTFALSGFERLALPSVLGRQYLSHGILSMGLTGNVSLFYSNSVLKCTIMLIVNDMHSKVWLQVTTPQAYGISGWYAVF